MRPRFVRHTLTLLQLLSIALLLVTVLLVALARFTPIHGLPGLHTHFTGQADAVRLHNKVLVKLSYATFAGVVNKSTGLNVFKGCVIPSRLVLDDISPHQNTFRGSTNGCTPLASTASTGEE
jgi:hypothetical protein